MILSSLNSIIKRQMRQKIQNLSNFNSFNNFNKRFFCENTQTSTVSDTPLEMVKFKFLRLNDNTFIDVEAAAGDTLLQVAFKYKQDVEGACDSCKSCSTCHMILEEDSYNDFEMPDEEETDLLDLAFGLTPTSRLGCQIIVSNLLEGKVVTIPTTSVDLS